MNLLRIIARKRAVKALQATMRPDPALREHRLAQFTKERRERYWRNVGVM